MQRKPTGMPRCLLAALVFCLLAANALALPLSPTAFSPGEQCRTAIAAAERGHGVPPQLLAAIGRVESGRLDPVTGVWGAWPWTINAEGQGSYFDTKAEAIQAVQALQARGVRSIDVGCMQINLFYHPTAFPSLDMAFEPAVNTDYAARFLIELHDQTGDWTKATADYHSANPEEGGPYAAKVISVWPEEQRKAGSALPVQLAKSRIAPFPSPIAPMPGRQPSRLFAMAGMPPMMMPPGAMPLVMASSGPVSPGIGSGQHVTAPGRTLDFYRSVPIRTVMPLRSATRLPNMVTR
jgi:Transglycosylase SLT domain